jgi:gliding motility-associated protein GldM
MSMPKEPRQLMINLMYLVLTALLALNVSNEILHAFKVINQSVTSSNTAIVDKNDKMYKAFDETENEQGQRDRVKPFNDRAKQIKAESQATIKYLEEWKEKVVARAGGRDEKGEIEKEDDIDASTFLLVEEKGGDEIKKKLSDLRAKMLSVVGDKDAKASLEKNLPIKIVEPDKTENNPQADWSFGYFHNMPTVAAVTLLSKFQNDVRNSEAAILNQLITEAGNIQIKFDEMAAIAVTKNSYVLAGQKVEANIMLAAYNKAVQPQVTTGGGGRVTKIENGVAVWETTASGVGLQTVKGTVSIDLGGRKETRPYEFQYMVGTTGASLQLDKMNVFYIGVPNPVTVSAAGYSLQDVSLSVEGATITPKDPGHYELMLAKPGNITARIMAKDAAGTKEISSMPIRVKFIPDPIAKIGGKVGGVMPASVFKAQLGVAAILENFEFDARFKVTSFSYSALPKRGDLIGPYSVKSGSFRTSPEAVNAQDRSKAGDKIFLDDIKAVGPDGRTRNLSPIILTLQ